jgi:hypothetical protein
MKLSITLTDEQVVALQTMSAKACYTDFKEFARDEFYSNVLGAKIGTPKVGAAPKITAPSTNKHYTSNNT